MKLLIVGKLAGLCFGLCGVVSAQPGAGPEAPAAPARAATAEVVASAQAAVADLGKEVVLGRYGVAIERMNPLWKERAAARMGGIEEMERQLAGVSEQMVKQGVSIISFQPQGQARSFEVGPGKKVENIGGEQIESLIYTKWLVLVPTVTKFRVFQQGNPKPIVIESTGYQAAISDKGKNDWTFIDGSSLTLNELRKMFINLPPDLELPPLEKREVP